MLGLSTAWAQRTVKLGDHQFVTVANPRGNRQISLIFMRLPDGNLNGRGFKDSHFESIAKLESGAIQTLHSTDGQSYYSKQDLKSALLALMTIYNPTDVRTQTPYNVNDRYSDHSDHTATGRFAERAYEQYSPEKSIPIAFYTGYPIHNYVQNVFGDDLQRKIQIFDAYNDFDKYVCQSVAACLRDNAYGTYLTRQYRAKVTLPLK